MRQRCLQIKIGYSPIGAPQIEALNSNPILSTAYLPPIEWLALLAGGEVRLERLEHYQKQSYRNRTCVMTGNGVQHLSVPVLHSATKMPVSEVRIEYKTPWQRNHWRTLVSAYGNSPYFLFYRDALQPFYEEKTEFLFEFNLRLVQILLQLMGIRKRVALTDTFEPLQDGDTRTAIRPGASAKEDYPFKIAEPYCQVFAERYGFVPNLSAVDLLFNVGPDSSTYLLRQYRRFNQESGQ